MTITAENAETASPTGETNALFGSLLFYVINGVGYTSIKAEVVLIKMR